MPNRKVPDKINVLSGMVSSLDGGILSIAIQPWMQVDTLYDPAITSRYGIEIGSNVSIVHDGDTAFGRKSIYDSVGRLFIPEVDNGRRPGD